MKTLLVCAVLVLGTVGFGADLQAVRSSQRALVGALEGATDNYVTLAQHIPGYGLQITVGGYADFENPKQRRETITALLQTLAPTVQGLDKDDWVSVGYTSDTDIGQTDIVVRMRPGDPESLEAWVNGEKRP